MKIGIIGSGDIGGNLGLHLTNAGHEVIFSSRHPDRLETLAKQAGPKSSVGTVEEAAEFGDIIILAVPFKAVKEIAEKIGHQKGKAIIETTNPYPNRDGEVAQRVRDSNKAASVFVAEHFPEAHVLKAFNTIYFKNLRDDAFLEGDRRAIPYAGDHKPSLNILERLIDEIGFAPVYVGQLSESHPMDVEQELYTEDLTAAEVKQILEDLKV